MRTVQEHLAAVLGIVAPLPPLDVSLPDAVGCILAEDIVAHDHLPVADLAAVDGYAVAAADVAEARPGRPVELRVLDEVRAGSTDRLRSARGAAVRIASGAPVPSGTDAVVPLDSTDRGSARVTVTATVTVGENLRRHGEDLGPGEVALAAGQRISARHIGVLAALGHGRVPVHPKPRVVIISVGDELVEPGRAAAPGQIFDANGHALATAAADAGVTSYRVAAVPDRPHELRETIEDQLVRADLIVTTGGLSYGSNDTVKEVLSGLGTVRFDRVAMSPGRQHGLGTVGDDVPILALPGDPVAAYVAFELFVRPALLAVAGYGERFRQSVTATMTSGWRSSRGEREFVRVTLSGEPGTGYRAALAGPPHALHVSGLARANALAVVPEDVDEVRAGDPLSCLVLDA